MPRLCKFIIVVFVLGVALAWYMVVRPCCGARVKPSAVEAAVARNLRSLSIPSVDRDRKNPFTSSPELLKEASEHFADHCAVCHNNDGSGQTEMGRNFYPPVPDMRQATTQQLTDGEIYSIIHNGVRWTAMPAWGESDKDEDSWKLVPFIRHLPQLTPGEIREMERFNPRNPVELEEEKAEQEFLKGDTTPSPEHKH